MGVLQRRDPPAHTPCSAGLRRRGVPPRCPSLPALRLDLEMPRKAWSLLRDMGSSESQTTDSKASGEAS